MVSHALRQVDDQFFFYGFPALALVLIAIVSIFRKKSPQLDFPFFGTEEGNPEAPKQRWMRDAMNLLREGYEKVIGLPFLR